MCVSDVRDASASSFGVSIRLDGVHSGPCHTVRWHPRDAYLLLSAGLDSAVNLHDLRRPGTPVHIFRGHCPYTLPRYVPPKTSANPSRYHRLHLTAFYTRVFPGHVQVPRSNFCNRSNLLFPIVADYRMRWCILQAQGHSQARVCLLRRGSVRCDNLRRALR